MKTQHTEGPWEYMDSSIVGPKIDDHEKWLRPVVARFATGVSLGNLNLMLAAPDLLEALKVLVENGGIGPEQMFHDARTAIAKATGGIS